MSEAWATAIPSVIIGILLLTSPGATVVMAGWGLRSLRIWLLAPAISMALIAGSATLSHVVGLRWSLLPVIIVTAIAAAGAFTVRRWIGPVASPDSPTPPRYNGGASTAAALTGLVAACVIISAQLMSVFGDPQNISQTFDNVVHLNAVRLALDSGDASLFGIGATSGIAWYPNGWHSIVTLVAQLGGGTIPLAVNASNIAICAFAWPASILALTSVVFADRPAALGAAAALSTGFGAFPLLLLYFGVLYPNATAYAIIPAGVAAVWLVLHSGGRRLVRDVLLLGIVVAGITMAHPNALLALYALTIASVIWTLADRARRSRTRRDLVIGLSWSAGLVSGGVVLWRFARTNAEMSGWSAWQSTAQAFGEAALISPRSYPITVTTAVLLLLGIAAVLRRPRRWMWVGAPFAAAAFLFIVVSGVPAGTRLRDVFTSPWYNDSFRLAALLPVVGIAVGVIGAIVVADLLRAGMRRAGVPSRWSGVIVAVGVAALFSVAVGPNVTAVMNDARVSYRLDDTAALLTSDEAAVLERLDDTTPSDALIIVNPWTGGSLAFALADRDVTALHIFGSRSADIEFLDAHLAEIDTNPGVCEAVARVGADFVLDFGDQNVFNNPSSGLERTGLNYLTPSSHLVLVDSAGPNARLFAIEGC